MLSCTSFEKYKVFKTGNILENLLLETKNTVKLSRIFDCILLGSLTKPVDISERKHLALSDSVYTLTLTKKSIF